jgi:hypothetical protein
MGRTRGENSKGIEAIEQKRERGVRERKKKRRKS